ncbi:hypothetical protein [Enterococcus sp. AZ163]
MIEILFFFTIIRREDVTMSKASVGDNLHQTNLYFERVKLSGTT